MLIDEEKLKQYSPFDGLQEEYLAEALEQVSVEEIAKGKMLFKRGRANTRRYFLIEGRVDLIDAQYNIQSLRGGHGALTTLNPDSPTRCSCVVKDSTAMVFSIEAEVLDRLVAWSESAESAFEAEMSSRNDFDPTATGQFDVVSVEDEFTNDWMSSLLSSPLFSRVPLALVQDLFAKFNDIDAEVGQIVIKEGEQGDFFYVIASGRVRITNKSGSVDIEMEAGQHFGEEALLGDTLRNATVEVIEPAILKQLGADDFNSLLTEPVLKYLTAEQLAALDKPHKVIDVKMPLEYRAHHYSGAINLPLSRLRAAMKELAQSAVYVIPDDCGSRSKIAAHLMCQAGFDAYIIQSNEESVDQVLTAAS
jgi:CRP-like cAMP-binding protein